MQQYYDLEMNIMSCLLLKPELMQDLKLEDKYFIKHNKLIKFMRAFYKRYGTFDSVLMFNACKDKYEMVKYLRWLADCCVIANADLFNTYQNQLIELHERKKKERWIIEQIYELANNLYVGNIDLEQFKLKIKEIEENAEKVFEEEKNERGFIKNN